MNKDIFGLSNSNTDYTVSTLDMSTAVRNDKYTILSEPNYSATSSVGSMFVKTSNKRQMGGVTDNIKSISSIGNSELRKIFDNITDTKQNTNSAPKNINDLVSVLNSMSEQKGGNNDDEEELGTCGRSVKTIIKNEDGEEDDELGLEGGGGNKEMLESMGKLNKHIAAKAGIKFPQAMKISKHYREEAKKTSPNANIIELNNMAMKIVDKDADSGKLSGVVKKITGVAPSRAKRSSKKTKSVPKKGKKYTKKGGFSSSADEDDEDEQNSLSSELSFISTSED